MDMIDIKTKLWDLYYISNDKEYLFGYVMCLYDNKFIDDGNYCELSVFISNMYK